MKTKQIIIGAAVGATVYLVYKKWDKIKGIFVKKTTPIPTTTTTPVTTPPPTQQVTTPVKTQTTGLSAYNSKVMKLQALLGISIDGYAGKQTNGYLEAWWTPDAKIVVNADKAYTDNYPNLYKNGKGKVAPANIDYYISNIEAKTTPWNNAVKQGASSTGTGSTTAKINAEVDRLYNAGINGKLVRLRGTGYQNTLLPVSKELDVYTYDGKDYTGVTTYKYFGTHWFKVFDKTGETTAKGKAVFKFKSGIFKGKYVLVYTDDFVVV